MQLFCLFVNYVPIYLWRRGGLCCGVKLSQVVAGLLSSCASRTPHGSGFSRTELRLQAREPQQLQHSGLAALRHVGSSRTRDRTRVPCMGRWVLPHCATGYVPVCIGFDPQKLITVLLLRSGVCLTVVPDFAPNPTHLITSWFSGHRSLLERLCFFFLGMTPPPQKKKTVFRVNQHPVSFPVDFVSISP